MKGMDGKVALVTGGAAGIGRASALAFARAGARVVVADIDLSAGEETARLIREAGGEATFVAADVSRAAAVEALVAAAVARYGRLDCAHNNAGVTAGGFTHRLTEAAWDRVMAVNLKGVWLCMKYELAQLLRQRAGGAIVNTSSASGLVGFAGAAAYAASKHGVLGLTRTAALEYAPRGIRVNAVCPSLIRTAMLEQTLATSVEGEARLVALEPMGRLGTPEEVAGPVVWLCSDAASFVTGHALAVDGGALAQ